MELWHKQNEDDDSSMVKSVYCLNNAICILNTPGADIRADDQTKDGEALIGLQAGTNKYATLSVPHPCPHPGPYMLSVSNNLYFLHQEPTFEPTTKQKTVKL